MRPTLAAASPRERETDTMTEKQVHEIVQRAAHPPIGVPSQVKTDLGDLLSEITRRGMDGFEPEPDAEETAVPEADGKSEVRRTSGARKK
jgi:hypothetical protein